MYRNFFIDTVCLNRWIKTPNKQILYLELHTRDKTCSLSQTLHAVIQFNIGI